METKICKTYIEAEHNYTQGLDFMGNPMPSEMHEVYEESPHALVLLIMTYSTLIKKNIIDFTNKKHDSVLQNNDSLIKDVFNLIRDGIQRFKIGNLLSNITINGKPILCYIVESSNDEIFNLLLPRLQTDATPKQLKKLLDSINKGYHGSKLSEDLFMASSRIERGNPSYFSMARAIFLIVLKKNFFNDMAGREFTENNITKMLKKTNGALITSKNLLISKEKFLKKCLKGVHQNRKLLPSVFKKQYEVFVTKVGGKDLYWKLFHQALSVQKVILSLESIPSDDSVSKDVRKYLALTRIKNADLSLGAAAMLKEVLLYRMDKTNGKEADLAYIRNKTKYFSKMSQNETFGNTNTYTEILNHLNIRIKRLDRWQNEWNTISWGNDLQNALSLFATYSGSFMTDTTAWGGNIGRFFKGHWGAHHGQVVQACLQSHLAKAGEESKTNDESQSSEDKPKNHIDLIAFLAELKLKLGQKVLHKDGDLSIILQIIYENTGIEFDAPIENEENSITSESYDEISLNSDDDSEISMSI